MDIPSSRQINQTIKLPEISDKIIFYCVLNWGIGHASRSVPIIEALIRNNNTVILFSDGEAARFLASYFDKLLIIPLPSYNIKYDSKRFLLLSILIQAVKNYKIIDEENKILREYALKYKPEIVISDNRYGCYLPSLTNYFITHQLRLMTGCKVLDILSKRWIQRLITPFQEIWIPDDEKVNLSGKLSISNVSTPLRRIGITSIAPEIDLDSKPIEVLVLLSGPEPRRTKLEYQLLQLFKHVPYKITFIAGNFSTEYLAYRKGNVEYYSFKKYDEVLNYIHNATLVICRSGYSTLMDLYILNKQKVICIPTYGQPEQEYLAKQWSEKGWIKCVEEPYIAKNLLPQVSIMMQNL